MHYKQFNQTDSCTTLSLARSWGFDDCSLAYREEIRIGSAAAKHTVNDYGYQKAPHGKAMLTWSSKMSVGVHDSTTVLLEATHCGLTGVTDVLAKA